MIIQGSRLNPESDEKWIKDTRAERPYGLSNYYDVKYILLVKYIVVFTYMVDSPFKVHLINTGYEPVYIVWRERDKIERIIRKRRIRLYAFTTYVNASK